MLCETATAIAGGAARTVIVVAALLVVSVVEVPVKVTVAGLGTLEGAVYVIATPDELELEDSVPQLEPEHPAPARAHVTPPPLLVVATTACV